jgi:formylglycine-generating enzyme required for sulfatase activity
LSAVPRKQRKPEQQALIREAAKFHGFRWGAALSCIALIAAIAWNYVGRARQASRTRALESIAANVLSASPDGVPDALRLLDDYRDMAPAFFQNAFGRSDEKSASQLHAAFALSYLNGVQRPIGEYLVDAIEWAAPAECNNFVRFLDTGARSNPEPQSGSRAFVLALLEERFRNPSKAADKARYATVLLYLGDASHAESMTQLMPDPVDRTAFIHNFPSWHADLRTLPRMVQLKITDQQRRSALISALCVSLGLLDDRPLDREWPSVRDWLGLVARSSDGATHSAAEWALRKLGGVPPQIVPFAPQTDRRWFVNQFGMTMIAIPPGTVSVPSIIRREQPPSVVDIKPYFILDREVSMRLMETFINDPKWPADEKPDQWPGAPAANANPDSAAYNVSWYDAILFCNWLSVQEKREPCYRKTGMKERMPLGNESTVDCDVWEMVPDANGYRLPTDAQWVHACRAGSLRSFSFGDESDLLRFYGFFAGRVMSAAPGAILAPNGYGLFDMHGNVQEWCWDTHPPAAGATNPSRGPSSRRILRGGIFQQIDRACRSTEGIPIAPINRSPVNGFRVVLSE